MTSEQTAILVTIIYFVITILYVIIGTIVFKPLEGDWEMVNGVPCEKDADCQRGEMIARAFFWPLILTVVICFSPIILLVKLSDYIENKEKKEQQF